MQNTIQCSKTYRFVIIRIGANIMILIDLTTY